jgi:hypothetical protein
VGKPSAPISVPAPEHFPAITISGRYAEVADTAGMVSTGRTYGQNRLGRQGGAPLTCRSMIDGPNRTDPPGRQRSAAVRPRSADRNRLSANPSYGRTSRPAESFRDIDRTAGTMVLCEKKQTVRWPALEAVDKLPPDYAPRICATHCKPARVRQGCRWTSFPADASRNVMINPLK